MRKSLFALIAAIAPWFGAAALADEPEIVRIDFDPGSTANIVELGKAERVGVAIIFTPDCYSCSRLDDRKTALNGVLVEVGGYGGADHALCSDEDVNGDGVYDVVCHFDLRKLGLEPGKQEIVLTGVTFPRGTPFEGRDTIDVR